MCKVYLLNCFECGDLTDGIYRCDAGRRGECEQLVSATGPLPQDAPPMFCLACMMARPVCSEPIGNMPPMGGQARTFGSGNNSFPDSDPLLQNSSFIDDAFDPQLLDDELNLGRAFLTPGREPSATVERVSNVPSQISHLQTPAAPGPAASSVASDTTFPARYRRYVSQTRSTPDRATSARVAPPFRFDRTVQQQTPDTPNSAPNGTPSTRSGSLHQQISDTGSTLGCHQDFGTFDSRDITDPFQEFETVPDQEHCQPKSTDVMKRMEHAREEVFHTATVGLQAVLDRGGSVVEIRRSKAWEDAWRVLQAQLTGKK